MKSDEENAEGQDGKVRLFAGILPKDACRAGLIDLQKALAAVGESVRWLHPDDLHVTLKFFGDVPEDRLDPALEAAEEAARGIAPFRLAAAGIKTFDRAGHPRVLWADLAFGRTELEAAQAVLEASCLKLGFAPETRVFRPHFTLARIPAATQLDRELIRSFATTAAYPMVATELALMISFNRGAVRPPQAPHYRLVRSFPLSGRGATR